MLFRSFFSLSLLPLVMGSCATFPPPEKRAPEADQELLAQEDSPTTAEWLFVTAEKATGSKCESVATWLDGEKNCMGEVCLHARDLGKEWLERCESEAPKQATEIHRLVRRFTKRSKQAPDACIQEGTGLLRTQECGEPTDCENQAQRWITRCGPAYATPLFVLMLTRTLQRRFPQDPNLPDHKVQFDPRSCDALAEAVTSGMGCDGLEACAPAVEAGEAWMLRCFDSSRKTPITLAYGMADVRVGGGHGVEPIPVDPTDAHLPEGAFPLQLADHSGIVAWACGVRPKTIQGYLKARQDCRPGEIIVARMDEQKKVRVVSIPHPDDDTFARQYPFLRVGGEQEARDVKDIEVFRESLAQAVDAAQSSQPDRAIAYLTRALRSRDWAVTRQPAFQKILKDSDAALVRAFQEWAKRKVKSVNQIRGQEQASFANRTLQNPMHDMTLDGSVGVGSYLAPWSLRLDHWMPISFVAYRDSLQPVERIASRRAATPAQMAESRTQVRNQIRTCAQAQSNVQKANDEVLGCMALEGGCTQEKLSEIASKAEPDRVRADQARASIRRTFSLAILGQSDVTMLEKERISSGCIDP